MKPLFWVGSAKKDLKQMPEEVMDVFGYALHLAQSATNTRKPSRLKASGQRECLKS